MLLIYILIFVCFVALIASFAVIATAKENFLFTYRKNLDYRIKQLTKYSKKHGLYRDNTQKLSILDKIYCINLVHNTSRKNFITKQLKEQHIDIPLQFFQAIYGKYLKKQETNNNSILYNYNRVNFMTSFDLPLHNNTDGELGCVLSHLLVISDFIKSNHNYALVVEDDVFFGMIPFWDTDIKTIVDSAPNNWEIINLYSEISNLPRSQSKLSRLSRSSSQTGIYIDSEKNISWGTVAYIVNKNIKHTFNKYVNITNDKFSLQLPNNILHSLDSDISADVLFRKIFNSYSYKPDLFMPSNISLNSTVHDEQTGHFINIQNQILKYYDPLIKYIDQDPSNRIKNDILSEY